MSLVLVALTRPVIWRWESTSSAPWRDVAAPHFSEPLIIGIPSWRLTVKGLGGYPHGPDGLHTRALTRLTILIDRSHMSLSLDMPKRLAPQAGS